MWEQPGVNWRWKAKQILKVAVVILSLSWLWIVSKLVLQSSDFMHMLYACVHICGIFVCRHGTSRQEPTQRWNRLRLMMSLSWMTTALRLTSWCSANIVTSSNSMKRISSTRNSWFVFDYETDCRCVFRWRLSQLHPHPSLGGSRIQQCAAFSCHILMNSGDDTYFPNLSLLFTFSPVCCRSNHILDKS